MRLIHDVISDLQEWEEAAELEAEHRAPLGNVLEELLGGERGSLAELAVQFTRAGFGDVMASWIGNGPNLPIGASDLRHILGDERVQDLSTLAGMPTGHFLIRLARLLPGAVHRMTPQGTRDLWADAQVMPGAAHDAA